MSSYTEMSSYTQASGRINQEELLWTRQIQCGRATELTRHESDASSIGDRHDEHRNHWKRKCR